MYKYVFFDFNGTLIDDCNLCLKILNWICEEYNLPNVSKRKYRSIFTFPVYNYYVALGFKVSHEDFSIIGDRFHYFYNKYSFSIAIYFYYMYRNCMVRSKNSGHTENPALVKRRRNICMILQFL